MNGILNMWCGLPAIFDQRGLSLCSRISIFASRSSSPLYQEFLFFCNEFNGSKFPWHFSLSKNAISDFISYKKHCTLIFHFFFPLLLLFYIILLRVFMVLLEPPPIDASFVTMCLVNKVGYCLNIGTRCLPRRRESVDAMQEVVTKYSNKSRGKLA